MKIGIVGKSRYIDADKLLKTINENVAEAHNERCSQLLEAILNAPTADAVEVRHGEWLVCGVFDDFLKCSLCGYDRLWQTAIEHKYCPNCGAKMDGGRSENGKS